MSSWCSRRNARKVVYKSGQDNDCDRRHRAFEGTRAGTYSTSAWEGTTVENVYALIHLCSSSALLSIARI